MGTLVNALPVEVQPLVVDEALDDKFDAGLTATLGFREIAERVEVQGEKGDTITKSRPALFAPVTAQSTPAAHNDLDSGMGLSNAQVEQYTLTLGEYKAMAKTNVFYDKMEIGKKVLRDAYNLGEQANRSLDGLARDALFDVYQGMRARVTNAVSAAATIPVDDVRGFYAGQTVIVDPAGAATEKVIDHVTVDGGNTSTVYRGKSGTIVLTTSVTVAADKAVIGKDAPHYISVGGGFTTKGLAANATLDSDTILDAVAQLHANGIPTVDGLYNLYISAKQARGLFDDSAIRNYFMGQASANEVKTGLISQMLGVRLIRTNMNPVEAGNANNGSLPVQRAALVGAGALIEGNFTASGYAGLADASLAENGIRLTNGVAQIIREPMDALKHFVTQSWLAVLGYGVPTDKFTTSLVLPTASNAMFKRAIILESR